MKTGRRYFIKELLATTAALDATPELFAKHYLPRTLQSSSPISVFSRHMQWLDYSAMASTAKEIGFDGVDLTVRPKGHVLPENVSSDLPRAVNAIRKEGLDVFEITTAISEANEQAESILKVMRKLGIKYYRLNWFSYDPLLSIEENLKKFKVRIKKIAALNAKYKIHGAYQNHAGTSFGASVWDLYEVLKDFDPNYIGCQFDVKHATVEGGNSWVNDLRVIYPYIKTYNIKDFRWTREGNKWIEEDVPLGEGMVNFPKYFELVKLFKIAGPVSIHYEYQLGGAENGLTSITIPKEQVMEAMQSDLKKVRSWLQAS